MFDPAFDRWLRRQRRIRQVKAGIGYFAGGFLAAVIVWGLIVLMTVTFGTGR